MRNLYLLPLTFLLLASATAFGQSWRSVIKPGANFYFNYVATDPLDNIICASGSKVRKYDKTGTLLWEKVLTLNGISMAQNPGTLLNMAVDDLGNIYVASPKILMIGTTTYNFTDTTNHLIKFDANGNVKWIKKLPPYFGSSESYRPVLSAGKNGSMFICIHTDKVSYPFFDSVYSTPAGASSLILARFDTSGKVKWRRTYSSPEYYTYSSGSSTSSRINYYNAKISTNSSNEIVMAGSFLDTIRMEGTTLVAPLQTVRSKKAGFIALFDSNGTNMYVKQFLDTDTMRGEVKAVSLFYDRSSSMVRETTDTILAMSTGSTIFSKDSLYYYSPAGTVTQATALSAARDRRFSLSSMNRRDTSKSVYLAGSFLTTPPVSQTSNSHPVFLLRKYDSNGNILWERYLPSATTFSTAETIDFGSDFLLVSARITPPVKINNDTITTSTFLGLLTENDNSASGRVYFDFNHNNTYDAGDEPARYYNLNEDLFTDYDGKYVRYVQAGTFTDSVAAPPYYSVAPSAYTYSFAGKDSAIINRDFVFHPIGTVNDLQVNITPGGRASSTVPSFMIVTAKNVGTTTVSGSVKVQLSQYALFQSSSIAPSYAAGDSVGWTFTNLKPQHSMAIVVQVTYTPQPPNTYVTTGAFIDPIISDSNTANNADKIDQLLRASYDPNDKISNPVDTLNKTRVHAGDEFIDYTINFQNTGTDTARMVRITDELSPLLDVESLQIVYSTHQMIPTLKGILVEFLMPHINLPDSNDNVAASKGAVHFRIKVKSNLQPTDTIRNHAAIYFDYNEPVITNSTKNYLAASSLPVKLLSFTAVKKEKKGEISWISNINDAYGFVLEKSFNGRSYESIFETHVIRSSQPTYTYTDQVLNKGANYYRLKVVEQDGSFFYSNIVVLTGDNNRDVRVFPNPATDQLTFVGTSPLVAGGQIKIFTSEGKLVKIIAVKDANMTTGKINVGLLTAGSYMIELPYQEKTERILFMKH